MTAPLTAEEMAENVRKLSASPYGPGLHEVVGRDARGWYRTACDCAVGRAHVVGARIAATEIPTTDDRDSRVG